MNRKICVITSSRADYGLLKPFLDELRICETIELQLIVTGSHLSPEFGHTYKEIENDGFAINGKIEILLSSDAPVGISKTMGLALISFAEEFDKLKPDIVVVMGDRYEIFSAVAAAHVNLLPVAHISGGEVTEGVIDDAFRHSITKMSHLHFTATEEYRRRVIQLGENPDSVFSVGETGLDNIKDIRLLTKTELKKTLGIRFDKRNILITFHPVTLEANTCKKQFQNLLSVLEEQMDTQLIFTKTNADTDGRVLNQMIDDYVERNSKSSVSFTSLGRLRYLSLLQFVDAVVGNSSSGIVEAPSFKIGTIDVGDRQKGRVKAQSIINCKPTKASIRNAFESLFSSRFQRALEKVENPYESEGGLRKIVEKIQEYLKDNKGLKKGFFDLDISQVVT